MRTENPVKIFTYAASASLAAVILAYLLSPNSFSSRQSGHGGVKRSIVGLSNAANDCFINSVLQSLAGLRTLRLYLVRELHRRGQFDEEIYLDLPFKSEAQNGEAGAKKLDNKRLLSLQTGYVTRGLKEILDNLNERPLNRKTISAQGFVRVLENAFNTTISRNQQDAQELLQVVAERLADEYLACKNARRRAQRPDVNRLGTGLFVANGSTSADTSSSNATNMNDLAVKTKENHHNLHEASSRSESQEEENGFVMEGETESRIECQHCHFVPKPVKTSFVMLTLTMPQKHSCSLDDCIDGHFKTEYIEDYKCDRCRLEHAISEFEYRMAGLASEKQQLILQEKIMRLKKALTDHPEQPPDDIELPKTSMAPARKIARHIAITRFPNVLVVHLSRSLYNVHYASTKNLTKVRFPEQLMLGGLLNRRAYRLQGLITHKGTHYSGHYEAFRRQHAHISKSLSDDDQTDVDDNATAEDMAQVPEGENDKVTTLSVPLESLAEDQEGEASDENFAEASGKQSPSPRDINESFLSLRTLRRSLPKSATSPSTNSRESGPPSEAAALSSITTPTQSRRGSLVGSLFANSSWSTSKSSSDNAPGVTNAKSPKVKRKKRTPSEKWWRISDDKVTECKLSQVLDMQKEAYMLFYEMYQEDEGNE